MEKEERYGINYKVIKIENKKYLLFPVSLIKGDFDGFDLIVDNKSHRILTFVEDLKSRYVLDSVYSLDELKNIYDIDEEEEFISGYFFEDKKDKAILIEIHPEIDAMKRTEIDLKKTEIKDLGVSCLIDKNVPSVLLNENTFEELLSCGDIHEIRVLLEKYHNLIGSFKEMNKNQKVTRINLKNGKVSSVETVKSFDSHKTLVRETKERKVTTTNKDISYIGLRNHIKSCVFSHEEEIDTFATKLYMNYTAEKGEEIESILLVGPTGVGKTETVKRACEYLNIPYFIMNASNLVPQGIKGISIEDVMIALYELAGRDLEKAERGLVFLDEYDKLNASVLDYKAAIKNILLTFTAGGDFPVQTDDYMFIYHSQMTNKVFAGVFSSIMEKEKKLGFEKETNKSNILKDERLLRKKLIEKKYFTQEELSRINTILGYEELSRDIKKDIILKSKISEYIKKKERYERQFGIDLIIDDSFVEAILDIIEQDETGMRIVNNLIKKSIDNAEKSILENPNKYKQLVLTKDTATNNKNYQLN